MRGKVGLMGFRDRRAAVSARVGAEEGRGG